MAFPPTFRRPLRFVNSLSQCLVDRSIQRSIVSSDSEDSNRFKLYLRQSFDTFMWFMRAFVEFNAIVAIAVIAIHVNHVNPVPSGQNPLWRGTYTQSSYWYSDYAAPKPSPKKEYLPIPQYCPETGRTVCAEVKPSYPTYVSFWPLRPKRFRSLPSLL